MAANALPLADPVARFLEPWQPRPDGAPPWLSRLRERGADALRRIGFPTSRLEDWKYTDPSPILARSYRVADAEPPSDRSGGPASGTPFVGAVFENGRGWFLVGTDRLPAGVTFGFLREQYDGEILRRTLGRLARPERDGFLALATAFLSDGLFLHVQDGVRLAEPLHVVFRTVADAEEGVMVQPRVLVVLGREARVSLVEEHRGTPRASSFVNSVGEAILAPGSEFVHCRWLAEGAEVFHVSHWYVQQEARSRFFSHVLSCGGGFCRSELATSFAGEGGRCELYGLYLGSGRRHVDHHTSIEHRAGECTSRQLYKGILGGHARGVFRGRIVIHPHARKSDAHQANHNLLLSPTAGVDTKPQLEIFADDVKCSHGATIGRLDENALFYLRARGIGLREAREMLVRAFAREIVERVEEDVLRERAEELVRLSLPTES
ncbi:MAG: Fe-S cluster assembly protein SufD [Candidatus Binatia bacterium]|nr:MAG: Fe-S cluster assembly protein SufD [Candidatus Binatia bacterium]